MNKESYMYFVSCPRCNCHEFVRYQDTKGIKYYECIECKIAYLREQLKLKIFWPRCKE